MQMVAVWQDDWLPADSTDIHLAGDRQIPRLIRLLRQRTGLSGPAECLLLLRVDFRIQTFQQAIDGQCIRQHFDDLAGQSHTVASVIRRLVKQGQPVVEFLPLEPEMFRGVFMMIGYWRQVAHPHFAGECIVPKAEDVVQEIIRSIGFELRGRCRIRSDVQLVS